MYCAVTFRKYLATVALVARTVAPLVKMQQPLCIDGLYNFGNGSYESYESYERYESYESLAKINFGNESYGDFILVG